MNRAIASRSVQGLQGVRSRMHGLAQRRGADESGGLTRAAISLLRSGNVVAAQALLKQAPAARDEASLRWTGTWLMRRTARRSVVSESLQHSVDAMPCDPIVLPRQPRRLSAAPSDTASETAVRAGAPIRITALGGFGINIDGVPYSMGAKPQRKPLDLLKMLLVCNGSGLGAAELADQLWPDADGDKARNSLQVAIYRLRRLLGNEQAVIVRSRRIFLDPSFCDTDLWDFGRAAESFARRGAADPASHAFARAALKLYRGHLFAQETEQAWMLAPRARIRRIWLCLIKQLGDWYQLHGGWDHASELYQDALDLDPLAEEIYRRLMFCQQKTGEQAEALRTYRRCREQLHGALGLVPSIETERLHHALREARG